jgi:hypothetical protein
MMAFQMHTREEVVTLLNDAFDVWHITPDELHTAIARLTNVRESESIRNKLIDEEHERIEERMHPVTGEELLEPSPADE